MWDRLVVAQRLQSICLGTSLVMMGTGLSYDAVARAVERQALKNIQLIGFVDEITKWTYLRSATVFVSPSHEEGWGIAIGEAIWAATPVVVYDLPEYCDHTHGIVQVSRYDVEPLVMEITRITLDSDHAERLRKETKEAPRTS